MQSKELFKVNAPALFSGVCKLSCIEPLLEMVVMGSLSVVVDSHLGRSNDFACSFNALLVSNTVLRSPTHIDPLGVPSCRRAISGVMDVRGNDALDLHKAFVGDRVHLVAVFERKLVEPVEARVNERGGAGYHADVCFREPAKKVESITMSTGSGYLHGFSAVDSALERGMVVVQVSCVCR